jgi:hypothetical protein
MQVIFKLVINYMGGRVMSPGVSDLLLLQG